MSKFDEPAFPVEQKGFTFQSGSGTAGGTTIQSPIQHYGLTKREYFASNILQGLVGEVSPYRGFRADVYANVAVELADALIHALGESK